MIDGKLNVLFAASECAPLCKTGGLADVVSALPKALSKISIRSSIILPYYSTLPQNIRQKAKMVEHFNVDMGNKQQYAGLLKTVFRGRTYYFIDNEEYFKRDRLYGYFEDTERFIFFSLAVLKALDYIDGIDVIHCNDWQTALIPVGLKCFYHNKSNLSNIKTVYTIHNLRFQGKLYVKDFLNMVGLSGNETWIFDAIHHNQVNLMKAALYHADLVTTVSKNYAKEIVFPYNGETLDGCIRNINQKLIGIINGIDDKSFNPNTDQKIYVQFSDIAGKRKNKEKFCSEYYIKSPDDMMIGMVTRLDKQKGLDLVLYAIDEIMKLPVTFVLIGTGLVEYENAFAGIEAKYPDRARCFIMYDDDVARKIYAASDVFLMPSKFEPCGLGQMIAMRYGSLPIVRETGGLADTVIPYNEFTGKGTGFSFANYNSDELLSSVQNVHSVYTKQQTDFAAMAERAMVTDFSWKKSARRYKKLYLSLAQSND